MRATSGTDSGRYDAVGRAGVAGGGTAGPVTATSDTLAAGSFAEVTAIDSGHTVLVRLVNGATAPGRLVVLSGSAAALLGVSDGAPVRIRPAQPSPPDMAALIQGRAAAPRLDAPPVLLAGLRARLTGGALPEAAGRVPPVAAHPVIAPALPHPVAKVPASTPHPPPPKPKPAPAAKPAPAPAPAVRNGYFVQVASLGDRAKAQAVAHQLGGFTQPVGALWRIRIGPFATEAEANRARDAAGRHGYGGAVLVRQD